MCSTGGVRPRIVSNAGTKSSATVQQRQPLASSTMFSCGQDAAPQALRISPSIPTSPNSFTITANRPPFPDANTWRISVVLPPPNNPGTILQPPPPTDFYLLVPTTPSASTT